MPSHDAFDVFETWRVAEVGGRLLGPVLPAFFTAVLEPPGEAPRIYALALGLSLEQRGDLLEGDAKILAEAVQVAALHALDDATEFFRRDLIQGVDIERDGLRQVVPDFVHRPVVDGLDVLVVGDVELDGTRFSGPQRANVLEVRRRTLDDLQVRELRMLASRLDYGRERDDRVFGATANDGEI